MSDKTLTIFAGANGSGKSTISKRVLGSGSCPGDFVCPDNLLDRTHTDTTVAYVAAMNKAAQERETALVNGVSFSFETVLSIPDKVDFIRRAKNKGYVINAHYVLTSDVSINVERVKIRVSQGGHDVPHDKILSRYEKTMSLMPDVLSLADTAVIYDNSGKAPKVLMLCQRGIGNMDNGDLPPWFMERYYGEIVGAFK